MSVRGERGEAEVRDRHQHEADEDRPLHAHAGVHRPADEHARQQRDEADADVVERDLVVAESEVLEQQAQRQVGERVPNLVDEHEGQDHQRTLTPQELGEGTEIRRDRAEDTGGRRGWAAALRLAHDDADEHGRQGEQRAGRIRERPARPRRDHQRHRARRCGANPPAVLRHARADTQLWGFEQLDSVRVDDDVVGRAGNPDEHGRGRDRGQRGRRIGGAEKGDRRHDEQAHQPEPRSPLAEAAEDRNADGVHERRPQPFEVVGEERERKRRDGALPDPVLRETGRQRRPDHREGETRRDSQEGSGQRSGLDVRPDAVGQSAAPVACSSRAGLVHGPLL